ncbi:hypothetical protein HanXRQr2_Chr13g0594231 [Helianthus annuus]|uniref:Uncharacterized protein n=1 Tax=Helianthus annuus TaxID=4232 RepID=A0A251VPE7_HELAN|nr:hypothetical protein HanXRQr2_Chr13g0594231 [Helianthus annuus]KAJ0849730.1 hypothetical protein HanPSC8_Chr13g0572271 [Helianthus annuus]
MWWLTDGGESEETAVRWCSKWCSLIRWLARLSVVRMAEMTGGRRCKVEMVFCGFVCSKRFIVG